jgi:hypothetical protein
VNALAYQIIEEKLTDTYPAKPWAAACRDPKPGMTWKEALELSRVELQLTAAKKRLARVYRNGAGPMKRSWRLGKRWTGCLISTNR